MPPGDFKLPDDFPDLSLGEKNEPSPRPNRPPPSNIPDLNLDRKAEPPVESRHIQSTPAAPSWRPGDRVLAPWEPTFLYVGTIAKIEDDQALIEFDDGDTGWVLLESVRSLAVPPGQKVMSRKRMGPHFFPGKIKEVQGEDVLVGFDDGGEEWTRIAALRFPCQPTRGASPTKVGSHLAFLEHLRPGDRVWAPWTSNTLYVGTVDRVQGSEAHIRFADGYSGWVLLEQLVPWTPLAPGLRVLGRQHGDPYLLPATVTQVEGDRVYLTYDDGGGEWTSLAALALGCQPFGPDARPTGGGGASGGGGKMSLGWLFPVAFILLFIFLRAGCR